jgi:hypothetical protein
LDVGLIEYFSPDKKFFDWRDEFIMAFNYQMKNLYFHKCPKIVLKGEPNTGKTSFVKFLFGKFFLTLNHLFCLAMGLS